MAAFPLIPSILPSPSLLPVLQPRRTLRPPSNSRNIEAHISPHNLPPIPTEPPSTATPQRSDTTKRKQRKPRAGFYDQTLERWSVKVPSPRSRFPWQETQTPITTADCKTNLEMIVKKLNDGHPSAGPDDGETTASSSVDEDESPASGKAAGFRLGSRVVPPWAHGAKRGNRYAAEETRVWPERLELDGEDGDGRASLVDFKLNVSSDSNFSDSKSEAISSSTMKSKALSINVTGETEIEDNSPDPKGENQILLSTLEPNAVTGRSGVDSVVEKLHNSLDESGREGSSNSDDYVAELLGSLSLPWEREGGVGDGERSRRRSNTELAERVIPEPELRRLRNASLSMKERVKVGSAGVTDSVVEAIHEKWKLEEVVRLKVEGPCSLNMRRTHETLEAKTGGVVIWRSGSSLVIYRGMSYELPCVKSYSEVANVRTDFNAIPRSKDPTNDTVQGSTNGLRGVPKSPDSGSVSSFPKQSEGPTDTSDINSLLDQLGPRFRDWSGRDPLPVDADLLPGVVQGYKSPYRILPYRTRTSLSNSQMTYFRRLARTMAPHFALGRSRQHQGLAKAIVKLWEKSALAKIAIKRGVYNTCNERMAEEIKKLTGGVLLSRNKEYIVFYRGNDFLTPSVREILVEKQKLAVDKQDEEETARLKASSLILSNVKTVKGPLVAGTLAETMEAKARWANQLSSEGIERKRRHLILAKQASLVRYLERKLVIARAKVRRAENALSKVQEFLQPAELPTDLEIVTDEERSLFRKMGLKMRGFLLLGRREVFDGTIQNMHLHWKHRELVKLFVKGKNFAQVKHIAISLEAESGGVLISLDKTTKGYAIIIYRGKNYQRPTMLRPQNLLTRKQALARSIELQRREALNHHISKLRERIQRMRDQLDKMKANKALGNEDLELQVDDAFISEDEVEDEGEEAYLETYIGDDEGGDDYKFNEGRTKN